MRKAVVTASVVINSAEKLEERSAEFYEELAGKYPQNKHAFQSYAKESKASKTDLICTYQETITDAIEACFSFKNLDLQDQVVLDTLKVDNTYLDTLRIALILKATR